MKIKKTLETVALCGALSLALLFFKCEKEPICHEEICEFIYYENDSLIKKEIASLTSDLLPKPSDDDRWGHSENLDILIERLNKYNCLAATKVCYACIKTLPPQSEVKLVVTYNKEINTKIMDLSTSDKVPLRYARLHNK
ncbi:unnamed protein product [marine sediment metagenome]|uniref:Uncharacterized protein n=1 Tax=marine sediment metagenome TaxID=412755 RepID=X1SLB6_9ZZZZ